MMTLELDRDIYADPQDRQRAMTAFSRDGFIRDFEFAAKRKNGAVIHVIMTATIICDDTGAATIRGFLRDITGAKRLQEQFVQAQKMDAVGRLAGGVAHDFNNILSVIMSYSGFILEELPADSPLRPDVLEIKSGAERAAVLTRQLLAFCRVHVADPQPIELNTAIRNILKMLSRLIGEQINLDVRLSAGTPVATIDPAQFEQILVNLAVNARDAMPGGGTLIIETASALPDVMVRVSDTGTGMDAGTLKRIFEPFFTTKPVGKGTGLGLSMVHDAVRQNGGRIEVESTPGQGTHFTTLFLACAGAQLDETHEVRAADGRGETILVVDDDGAMRSATARVLTRGGYRVLQAPNGGEALRMIDGSPEIALVLTDVVMPGISGIVLIGRARTVRPDMKCILMSGYNDEVLSNHGLGAGQPSMITKPFEHNALLARVREVLDNA